MNRPFQGVGGDSVAHLTQEIVDPKLAATIIAIDVPLLEHAPLRTIIGDGYKSKRIIWQFNGASPTGNTAGLVAKAWFDGEPVQWFVDGKWVDILDVSIATQCPSFSDQLNYRIKPKYKLRFVHAEHLAAPFDVGWCLSKNVTIFEYPDFTPGGPHFMFELKDGKILRCLYSDSMTIHPDFN